MTNGIVHTLLWEAYQPIPGGEIVGQPDWVRQERFSLEAVASRPLTREEMRMMLRRVLAERFELEAGYEVRARPVYALVLARDDGRLGPGIRRSEHDCQAYRAARSAEAQRAGTVGQVVPSARERASNDAPLCEILPARGDFSSGGVSMDRLAEVLTGRTDRRVVNQTGLEGDYEFTLSYVPDPSTADPSDLRARLFTALEAQLGLRLVATEVPLEVLVIHHIERPSPN